ncbi:hypothetical protein FQA39_LY18821 [Lamprigera yunnana]|nr:hypothetical protein FQA39_LY18821 [Lamprigera yunnana]
MKVAIVGAGVAGVVSLKYALEAGFECDCFEETETFGGTWVYTEKTGNNEYGFLFTELCIRISFKVQPEDEDKWMITTRNVKTKIETSEIYDFIFICNGHFRIPRIPNIAGRDLYTGLQIHSGDYRTPDLYKDKRVLVIGGAFSGLDICNHIKDVAKNITMSHWSQTLQIDKIIQKPAVERLYETGAIFTDGTKEDFDVILFCTVVGYEYKYPFLTNECGISVEDNWVRPLHKHCVNIKYPSMFFIGIPYFLDQPKREKLPAVVTSPQMLEHYIIRDDKKRAAEEQKEDRKVLREAKRKESQAKTKEREAKKKQKLNLKKGTILSSPHSQSDFSYKSLEIPSWTGLLVMMVMRLHFMNQIRNVWKSFNKNWCSLSSNKYVAERLQERGLIRVAGADVSDFLQGLITNDINHLHYGMGSMYTMFLNTRGRIMFDAIIYRTSQDKIFLVECDAQIDITSVQDEFHVYTVFNPANIKVSNCKDFQSTPKLEGLIVPCTTLNETLPETSSTCKTYKDLSIYQDPRVGYLGSRIIAPIKSDVDKQILEIFNVNIDSKYTYRWFRYNLGIGEGINDLPIDNSFPLEANCDYLHGVSFHKGCYVGQELTARTHHTGVVRKRLMPLIFSQPLTQPPEENKISHNGVNLGKLRGVEGDAGLGLLRITKALELEEISVGNGRAKTSKPFWWPFEAPKERISVQKT